MHKICTKAVAILILACASHVSAAVVVYDESVSGDLSDTTSPLTNFTLDVGTNTVTGRVGTATGFPFDFDSFAFTVPAGMQLVSGSVTMNDSPGNTADFAGYTWGLFAGSPNYNSGSLLEFMSVGSPDTFAFTSTPLAANVYNLSAESAGYAGNPPTFADYTFSLVVTSLAPVPEPATFMIWGLAIVGVAICSKHLRKLAG
jgi:hypothetical protein